MDVTKAETVKTEELETRYERYKGILKDLTIMSDVFIKRTIRIYRDVQLFWTVLPETLKASRWM